jgi:hypothetical protein
VLVRSPDQARFEPQHHTTNGRTPAEIRASSRDAFATVGDTIGRDYASLNAATPRHANGAGYVYFVENARPCRARTISRHELLPKLQQRSASQRHLLRRVQRAIHRRRVEANRDADTPR